MDAVRLHQAGIDYAVATLGTATTPEHLRAPVPAGAAIVFAFDGDRAGRAAAWRALQHALPEAREGREIRFLFLPEGHDPDSLVARKGARPSRRAWQARCRSRSTWCASWRSRADLTHADGRARFAEAARPLFAQGARGGVPRAAARAARRSGRARPASGCESCGRPPPRPTAPQAPATPLRRPSARATHSSAGRGSLVRQASCACCTTRQIALEVERRRARGPGGAARSRGSRSCANCSTTCARTRRRSPPR